MRGRDGCACNDDSLGMKARRGAKREAIVGQHWKNQRVAKDDERRFQETQEPGEAV